MTCIATARRVFVFTILLLYPLSQLAFAFREVAEPLPVSAGQGASDKSPTESRRDSQLKVITPPSLAIKAERGAKIAKVVTLNSIGASEMRNLTFVLSPLRTSADYMNDLDSPKLTINPSAVSLGPGSESVDILVSFDLSELPLRYGEFSSELRVLKKGEGENAIETEVGRIPVNLKVRDSSWWPFAVLALGVLVGMSVGWYRVKGQAQDRAMADIEQLQIFLKRPGVPEPFVEAITELTADATASMGKNEWTSVHDYTQRANDIILRFDRARLAWLEVWNFCLELRGDLAKHRVIGKEPVGTNLFASLDARFDATKARFANADYSPIKARQDLNALLDQIRQYSQVCNDLSAFAKERESLNGSERENWEQIWNQFRDRFAKMGADDFGPNLDSLRAEIQARLAELKSIGNEQSKVSEAGLVFASKNTNVPKIEYLAEYKPNWFRDRIDHATTGWSFSKFRIRGYKVLGYVFPALVFVYTGIQQHYWGNAVFGTLPDYVSLFLWGFAADASGTQVQTLVQQAGSRLELPEILQPAKPAVGGS